MKKSIYLAASLPLFGAIFGMQVKASQPQLSAQIGASSFFNQWRLGIGLAVEYLNMEAKLKAVPDPGLEDIGTQQSQTGKHLQIAPCIEFGNTFANSYYLGLMVSWRYSGLKSDAKSLIEGAQYFQHQFKLNHYADILAKVGYKITPRAMLYGLIGPSITNWTHSSRQFKRDQDIAAEFKMNKTSVGLCLGVGVECYVHKNYVFSIDYTHHLHSPVSKSHSMSYDTQDVLFAVETHSGDLKKKIDLSYGTIAIRFTTFFSL